jgi:hypothetical protein
MREAPLPDIIQLVSQGGKTGCFHVTDDHKRARIHLKAGRIVHAVTNEAEGLDAIYEVALWLDGNYHFEETDGDVPATITKPNGTIIMEMHRRMDEWRVISQKIGSLDLYPHSTLLPGETPSGVNPREAKLLAVITGYYSVEELAEVLQKPVLSVAKDLYGLVMSGHVGLKGVRSGKRPELPRPPSAQNEPGPAAIAPAPVPVPQTFTTVPEALVAAPEPVAPEPEPEPEAELEPELDVEPEEAIPTVPELPPAPEAAPRLEIRPVPAPKSQPAPALDPVKLAKLSHFSQRIAQTAKGVLPVEYHEMVNRLQTRANQQLQAGEGPEAVKNLALAVSRGAVEAGCDGDLVKNLNSHLKALFAK